MRLAVLALAASAVFLAAPPAAADHTCDLMPVVDPVELAACLASCVADHAQAGEVPECSFVHAKSGAAHFAPCPFADVACLVGCVRDHARDLTQLDCHLEGPL